MLPLPLNGYTHRLQLAPSPRLVLAPLLLRHHSPHHSKTTARVSAHPGMKLHPGASCEAGIRPMVVVSSWASDEHAVWSAPMTLPFHRPRL